MAYFSTCALRLDRPRSKSLQISEVRHRRAWLCPGVCDDCGHDYFVAFFCKGRGLSLVQYTAHGGGGGAPDGSRLPQPAGSPVGAVGQKRLRYFLQRDGVSLINQIEGPIITLRDGRNQEKISPDCGKAATIRGNTSSCFGVNSAAGLQRWRLLGKQRLLRLGCDQLSLCDELNWAFGGLRQGSDGRNRSRGTLR